ncbi:MAG: mechanosensitive ion channel [Methanomassiliicoccus sp.]|nr:mechanosensitive ion channel [Methanomassiliicoccus sp.]
MSWLDYPIWDGITLGKLLAFTILLVAATVIGKLISNLIRNRLDGRMGRRTSKKVARFSFYVIMGAAVLIGFSQVLRMDFSGLIISLGLVGVAIAFASQQIISNMLSGLMISIIRPIELEDWVEVGLAPTTGVCRVKDINLMTTVLRDVDGRIIIVPNSEIVNGKIINYTQAGFVAASIDLWFYSTSSIEAVRRIVLEEADRDPHILPNVDEEERRVVLKVFERPAIRNLFGSSPNLSTLNPRVNILDLREGKVKVNIRIWIREVNRRDEIISGFFEAIRERFKGEGISLCNP